jgi:hypothetical protein
MLMPYIRSLIDSHIIVKLYEIRHLLILIHGRVIRASVLAIDIYPSQACAKVKYIGDQMGGHAWVLSSPLFSLKRP